MRTSTMDPLEATPAITPGEPMNLDHLHTHPWYAPHQAWLAERGLPHHDARGSRPSLAILADAILADANLTNAKLPDGRTSPDPVPSRPNE